MITGFDPARYDVALIGIDKRGHWLLGEQSLLLLEAAAGSVTTELVTQTAPAGLVPQDESLRHLDVVFPGVAWTVGRRRHRAGPLELADLPYVGCGVMASAVAMDKAASKAVFAAAALPQVPYHVLKRTRWQADPAGVLDEIEQHLMYSVFVKPANMGSRVGVSKAKDRAGLALALDEASRYDRKIIVEQGIDAREIEVSVLGNDDPIASVPGEIVPCREFYDYAAKYVEPDFELSSRRH